MYKYKRFINLFDIVEWLNQNKWVKPISLTAETDYHLIYWEEEPQPQQKDLIPESDKTESL